MPAIYEGRRPVALSLCAQSVEALSAGNFDKIIRLFDSHVLSPPFNGALRDFIVELVSRIERIEAERGDIPRSARSSLDAKAQPYQDLIDRLLYLMAGLSETEASAIEDRLTRML